MISQAPIKEKLIVKPHPGGAAGAIMSLDEVASRMWASRNNPLVRQWVVKQLAAAGNPTGARDKAQAILDAYRKKVPYLPDPVQTEQMASPVQTLCLDPEGVCLLSGDCDDTSITLGACLLNIGIPVQVVGASYKNPTDVPSHVYIQFQDDAGTWVPMDGTTKYEVGYVHEPVRTWIVDPNKGVGTAGLEGGDFVGIGRAPHHAPPWQNVTTHVGLGAPRGAPSAPPPTTMPRTPSAPPLPGSSWPYPTPPLSNCVRGKPAGPTPQSVRDYYEDPLPGGRGRVTVGPGAAVALSEWGALAYAGRKVHGLGVWADDVDNDIALLDPFMVSLNASVTSCADMAASDVKIWEQAYVRWQKVKSDWAFDKQGSIAPGPVYGAGIEARLQLSRNDYVTFQGKVARIASCAASVPPVIPALPPEGSGPGGTSWVSDLKNAGTVVVGVAVTGVVVYGIYKVVEIAADYSKK